MELVKLYPNLPEYEFAKKSYFDIYNSIMTRGKGNLVPESIIGKPIQLDPSNIMSLIKNDYFVSTKVDGLRFLLMFSNENFSIGEKTYDEEQKERTVFFIDTELNYWSLIIGKGKIINSITGVDKCLIDGELVIRGQDIVYNDSNEIIKYTGSEAIFVAFDLLYGPINPQFLDEKPIGEKKNIESNYYLQLGPSSSMAGFKATDKWPTNKRRMILETMLDNPKSSVVQYLVNENFKTFKLLVSPFISLSEVLDNDDPYEYMKFTLKKQLEYQYSKYSNLKLFNIDTDGLIFTPKYMPYVIGTWSFCDNKQYKWKPINKLTIDFFRGPLISGNKYEIYVAMKDANVLYEYKNKKCILISNLKASPIMECALKINEKKELIFTALKSRPDKVRPNSKFVADSVIYAIEFEESLKKNDTTIFKYIKKFKDSEKNFTVYQNRKELLGPMLPFLYLKQFILFLYKYNIYELFDESQITKFLKMINLAKTDNSIELESKIRLFNPLSADAIIRYITGIKKNSIPMVRFYTKNNMRVTYLNLGNNLVPVDMNSKKTTEEFICKNKLETVEVSLGKEEVFDCPKYEDIKNYSATYQIRYVINTLSVFWSVEIINFKQIDPIKINRTKEPGENWEIAKRFYNTGPKSPINNDGYSTRIEIEYKPFAEIIELLKLYKLTGSPEYEKFLLNYLTSIPPCTDAYDAEQLKTMENKNIVHYEKYMMYYSQYRTLKNKLLNVSDKSIYKEYNKVLMYLLEIMYQ